MLINYPKLKHKSMDMELQYGEIHIWCASLEQPESRLQMLSQILSPDERKRAGKFYFARDRNRFITGRGILRKILSCYLRVEPSMLRFCLGKYGKPALADTFGERMISFNLSQSGGLALYAFGRGCEIGVDLEYIRDIPEMDKIAEQFFSEMESDVFREIPESGKKEAFFKCWTRKEAFIKAIGDGLSYPLEKFDVSFVPGEEAKLLNIKGDSKEPSLWRLQDLKLASGYAAALAMKGRSQRFGFYQWSD